MPRFKVLQQHYLIDGAWDGPEYTAKLAHFKAGVGAWQTTTADSVFVALGATSIVLVPAVEEQVDAICVTIEVDRGIWTATLDLADRTVTFVDTATGLVEAFAVVPEDGERSAGSYSLELMGIPAVETVRGKVTIDSVAALLYLQQIHAGRQVFGGVSPQDLQLTVEICFGLMSEKSAKLKAAASAAGSRATRATTALRKANEQRQGYGLPAAYDFDAEEAFHGKAADASAATVLREVRNLESRRGVLTSREKDRDRAAHAEATAVEAADRAQRELYPLWEKRGLARESLKRAQELLQPATVCSECEQPLQLKQRTGPGDLCPVCRQPDAGRTDRVARREQAARTAVEVCSGVEAGVAAAQLAGQKAVDARGRAREAAKAAAARVDAYRAAEVTPLERAIAQAQSDERDARTKVAAVRDRRRELGQIVELERDEQRDREAADQARAAWTQAEADEQEVRRQFAKWLSEILADKLIPMAPEWFRSASIDPKTFTPRVNGRSYKDLNRSAGRINLVSSATHLAFFEAARTMPRSLLPVFQWLDAPLDGLGGGAEGQRLAASVLQVLADTVSEAGADSQLIIATPQDLPEGIDGARTAELDSTRPAIPHARTEPDPQH